MRIRALILCIHLFKLAEHMYPNTRSLHTRKTFLNALLGSAVAQMPVHAAQESVHRTRAGRSIQKQRAAAGSVAGDAERKMDIWTHILPPVYANRLQAIPLGPLTPVVQMLSTMPPLCDVDKRLQTLEPFGNYRQVLTLVPFLHLGVALGNPALATELVSTANNALAELTLKHPDRFVGFAASLPMHDIDQALAELDRTSKELAALGVQIEANINGVPLDNPRFEPLFAKISELGKPVWIHPARPIAASDYPTEKTTRYPLTAVLGWPYETSICLARLVCAGHLERYPKLKIIAHHGGGMIPHFAGRLGAYLEDWGPRHDPSFQQSLEQLKKPLLDYFRMFYVDTALYQSPHSLECVLAFFGSDHVMFGTDTPFDPKIGTLIADAITTIASAPAEPGTRQKIFEGTAIRVLGIN